ncbi:MAG: hypothetical protein HY851_08785 [candidate division Zixibacteria bacterium]|nr:hypothetical protein [candidate division Zixibacteria bacterium]
MRVFTKLIFYEEKFTVSFASSTMQQMLARLDTTLSWAAQNYINVSKIGGQTASASAGITFPATVASAPGLDSLRDGTAEVKANMVKILGTAPDTTGASGRFRVNVGFVDGAALGTHTAGYMPTDQRYINGVAVNSHNGYPKVSVTEWRDVMVAAGINDSSGLTFPRMTLAFFDTARVNIGIQSGTGYPKVQLGGFTHTGATVPSVADLAFLSVRRVALTGTPSTSRINATVLTEGNNFWNDNMIYFKTGACAGQSAKILAFYDLGDSATLYPALSLAPSAGDSIIISPYISESGSGIDSSKAYQAALQAIINGTITPDSMKNLINRFQGITLAVVGNGATSSSIPTNLTQSTTDHWVPSIAYFLKGTLAGQFRPVTAYNGTTKVLTTTAFTGAPALNDSLLLFAAGTSSGGGSVTVAGYAAGQDPATLVLDATASGHNTAGTVGANINYAGTPSNWLTQGDLGIYKDTVNDPAATTSSFIGKVTVTGADFWKDKTATFRGGVLDGVSRRVTAYNYSTKTYTIEAAPSAPANGTAFVLNPVGSNATIAGNVTVGGYAAGQDPASLVLVTPSQKIQTNGSGQVVASSVQGPVTGSVASVVGPVGSVTGNVGGSVLGNVNGNVGGQVGGIAPNGISEPSFQSGAQSARTFGPGFIAAGALTNAAIDEIVTRIFGADSAGHTSGWFGANKMGGIISQTAASSLDSQKVANIMWGIVWGIAKAGYTDTSRITQRTVSGLSVTLDSTQLARIVARVVWGLVLADGDSSTAAQRMIAFNQTGLVNAIWNELKANHNTAGSFGANLDVPVSSVTGASGSGAYTWRIVVIDTSANPDTAIQQAQVWVNNPLENTNPYWAFTNNSGVSEFHLNAGSWVCFTTEPGFGQYKRSFSMSAAGVDTLKVYRGNTGRSILAFYNASGGGMRYANADVTIELVSLNDSLCHVGDTIIPSNGRGYSTARANSLGQLTIALFPNASFTNDSTWYRATVKDTRYGKLIDRFAFRMPAGYATVWLKDVVRWKEQ